MPERPRGNNAAGLGVDASRKAPLSLEIDGEQKTSEVEARALLVSALRESFGATAPHIGCETGRCGACTVLVDGEAVKSCLMLARQAEGSKVTTAVGFGDDKIGRRLQQEFKAHHALQCGFCTPGMLSSARTLLKHNPNPTEEDVRQGLRGNLCRCTGYQHIVEAVLAAAGSDQKSDEDRT